MAELRHVEAELETIRQAHYAAGDAGATSAGQRWPRPAPRSAGSRSDIRYRGRRPPARRAAAGRAEGADRAVGRPRRRRRRPSSSRSAEQIAAAEEQAELLAAQAEEQAQQPARARRGAARRAGARQRAARAASTQVQQQIQVLAADSATSTSRRASCSQRRERLAADQQRSWPRPTRRGWPTLQQQLGAGRRGRRDWPTPGCTSCRSRCRSSTRTRRAQQQAVNAEGAQAGRPVGAGWRRCSALQEKVQTDGKLKPWLAKHGLDGLQGLWSRIHIEPGWESALEAALRERLGALEVGRARHGARLRRRRAAGQAGVLHAAPPAAAAPSIATGLPRLARPAAPERRRPAGAARRLAATAVYTAAEPRRGAGRARASCARRGDHDVASGHAVTALQRQLLCARLRAGRPAGARAGDREPRTRSCARRR